MNRSNTNPRYNFYEDLKALVAQHQQQCEILILGDWNEVCIPRSTSKKLCDKFSLTDIWSHRNPGYEFATYQRGQRRIDFCIASQSVIEACESMIYEPFHYRLSGDHQGFYLDFSKDKLFKHQVIPTAHITQRRLKSKDRKSVGKYIEAVYNHLFQNSVFQRMAALQESKHPNHELVEKLDRELTRACQHGENRCKPRRPDYWSITIHILFLHVSVLHQVCRRIQKRLPIHSLTSRALSFGIEIDEKAPLPALLHQLKDVTMQYKKARKDSFEKRQAYLTEQANFKENISEHQAAKAIRQMRNSERRTRVYRYFKSCRRKGLASKSINVLKVPTTWPTPETYEENSTTLLPDPKLAEDWREVRCPKEIELLIKLCNRQHFGQSEHEKTSFTQEPLKSKLNWSASTTTADLILEGQYSPNDIDEISKLFLSFCKKSTELDSIPYKIQLQDFKRKFTKWSENTSTSPSGRHLGHYKAVFAALDKTLDDDTRTRLQQYQTQIANLYVMILNYALHFGYSLERWKQITNVMIYKEPGNVKIHRLRVIHLYEADYNFLIGLQWNKAIHYSQANDLLHSGQYGSRPGRDPTAVTLMEELRLDYSALTRTPMGLFDNDCSSCYDRILLPISSLIARGMGIHFYFI